MTPAVLERWLTKTLPRWNPIEVEAVVEVPGGWESDVYQVRLLRGAQPHQRAERLALRRYIGESDVARREFIGMRHLFDAGYPVPEVLAFEPASDVLGRPFMVMHWANGEIRTWKTADLDALAGLMADLHRLDWRAIHDGSVSRPPDASQLLVEWRGYLEAFEMPSLEACLEWAMQSVDAIRRHPAIVHLDFHTGNVLIEPDESATVIDWTQVGVADRRFDVAWTELLVSMALGSEAAARFREAYERRGGPLEDMEWFEMAMASKRLFSVLISLEAGPETMGMRPEARERMMRDIHTLAIPWRRVREISGIDVVEARMLFET